MTFLKSLMGPESESGPGLAHQHSELPFSCPRESALPMSAWRMVAGGRWASGQPCPDPTRSLPTSWGGEGGGEQSGEEGGGVRGGPR